MTKHRGLNQPSSFYLIFWIELWERFGFYGVQALLVLFMVKTLGFSDSHSDLLFGSFMAISFLLPCVGGYIGDQLIGTKRTILIGGIILAIGYLLLSIPTLTLHYVYLPLSVIAVGNGFFKANPSSLLSKAYDKEEGQYNRDSGFTLYYMAINIGAFVSMAITPILARYFGMSVAFAVCFIGLFITVCNFIFMRSRISDIGSPPDFKPVSPFLLLVLLVGSVLVIGLSCILLQNEKLTTALLIIAAVVYLMIYFRQIKKAAHHEKKPMILFFILFLQGVLFYILYIQMQTSLTLFALRNVAHNIFFVPMEAASFQALNPFWILLLSPLLAFLYNRLSRKKMDPSVIVKFPIGLILAGLAFIVLYIAIQLAPHSGIIAGWWLFLSYGIQSAGELLVSALGLSVAAKYVPQRLMGFAMGIWWLAVSVAAIIGGHLAALANVPKNVTDPHVSLVLYGHLFIELGLGAVIVGIACLLLSPYLKRLEPKELLS